MDMLEKGVKYEEDKVTNYFNVSIFSTVGFFSNIQIKWY